MNDIEKAIEHLKERVIFMENFLKEKESMGTIVLDKEKILNSMALNKLSIIALEKQLNGGWVSVSKMLPNKSGFYIVTERRGDKIVVAYTYFYDSGQWMGISDEVIAWQPLPKPYKEVEQ